ncbi:transglutaminaseTgpA domain-containing protein [Mumia qirimensis]|uniref:transglutaminaseTgpA domain-containing protein n=1 Tax=Mumia qirimensis TaxID=3234852 RepID=UPI00351D6327
MNARMLHPFWVATWVWLLAVAVGATYAPLALEPDFLREGALGAAVVLVTGAVARAAQATRTIVMTLEGVVAVGWLTASYGGATGIFGVVPTPATLERAQAVAAATYDHAQRYAAPVPDLGALTATLATLVVVLALAIDVLATELRWTPALGLVLLAVMMIPATLLAGDVSPGVFVIGAAAYAGLLAVTRGDEARSWGPRVPGVGVGRADPIDTAAAHLRGAVPAVGIAGGAIAVALVVPLLAPAASQDLFSGGGDGSGTGNGNGLANPILDMRRNLRGQSNDVMLTVQAEPGSPRPRYLRMASLQTVGQRGWSLGDRVGAGQQLTDELPAIPGLNPGVQTSTLRYAAAVAPGFDTLWLPHIYAPTAVRLEDPEGVEVNRSMLDITRSESIGSFAGETYGFDSLLARPTESELRIAPASTLTMSSFVELPPETPDVVQERAEEVTAGTSNDFDRAEALQRWFRRDGGFEYSLEAGSGSGMETIERFLTDERIGYCEQFATAMAMMARSLGIPSRVSIGFLSGEPGRAPRSWQFRGTDMHAWPELYFAGIGWVGFEPTPGGRGYTPPQFAEGSVEEQAVPLPSAVPTTRATESPSGAAARDDATGSADETGSTTSWRPIALVLAGLVLIGLVVPSAIRGVRRRRRSAPHDEPADAVEDAWAEVRDTAADFGIGWTEGASPRSATAPLRARLGDDTTALDALDTLVGAVELSRYAPAFEPEDLSSAVDTLSAAMSASVSRRGRIVARVMPRSVLVPVERRTAAHDDEVLTLQE